ncbi:MAG: multiheme c-type cytochrome, partial [Bryobacteraceae bacterium]
TAGARQGQRLRAVPLERRIDYFIGSGQVGRSYLIFRNGYLFQSPAAWFTKRSKWDFSPGYEQDEDPAFSRPVTPECLFCHAGSPRPIRGTQNRYEDPPFGVESISCERCHGDADAHIRAPSRANIVNPAKLPASARDSVCEQCHLSGEARILNPGKQLDDFQPGQPLEDVITVYVREAAGKGFRVVSHVEQLAQSACAQESGGRMWCGTCHDPHQRPVDRVSFYREKCLSCHADVPASNHPKPLDDCAGCHMFRRKTDDGAHTVFTDHLIRTNASRAQESGKPSQRLRPWRPPAPGIAQRNLGLAYIGAGERDQSVWQLEEGFRLLSGVQKQFSADPEVVTALGLVLLKKNVPAEATKLFEWARRLRPGEAWRGSNLAAALAASGQQQRAVTILEETLERDPSLEEAWRLLSELIEPAERRRLVERYRKLAPQAQP